MNRQDILFLFDYNEWANRRILSACARVTPWQFCAPAQLSHGSLRATLVHMLSVEIIWRRRCQEGLYPVAILAEKDYPAVDALAAAWEAEEKTMRAYLAGLTDEALLQPMAYRTSHGEPFNNTLWHLLAHVVNHGTQCRSEAAVALTAYGQSPGDLDLLYFFRPSST